MHSYSKTGQGWSVNTATGGVRGGFESEAEAAAFCSFLNGGSYDPDAVKELLKPPEPTEEDEEAQEAEAKAKIARLDPHERAAAAKEAGIEWHEPEPEAEAGGKAEADAKSSGYRREAPKAEPKAEAKPAPRHATARAKHPVRRSKR